MTQEVDHYLLQCIKEDNTSELLQNDLEDATIDLITGFNDGTLNYDFEEDVSPMFPQPYEE